MTELANDAQASNEFDDLDMEDAVDVDGADTPAEPEGPVVEWFVVHSYSGMEHKVKKNIEHRAESMGMTDRILEVVVPTETEIEIPARVAYRNPVDFSLSSNSTVRLWPCFA